MLLEKIVLHNFRQFYGKQEIKFSTDKKRNVTLVHAENGVGKTTLLNALLWCFYDVNATNFEKGSEIVSLQAVSEFNLFAKVEAYLEYKNAHFMISRETDSNNEKLVTYKIVNGNYEPLPNAVTFINRVLPEDMAKYFFFGGEYTETFAGSGNKKAVKSALEDMLGCDLANEALSDFKNVKKRLEEKYSRLTKGNVLAEGIQKRIDKCQQECDDTENRLSELTKSLDDCKDLCSKLEEFLRNQAGAKEIQEQRETFEGLKKKDKEREREIETEKTLWIQKNSLGLISGKAVEEQAKIQDKARAKGLIPSDVAKSFVDKILERKCCICDRSFEVNSEEEYAIRKLLRHAGTACVSDRLFEIQSFIGEIEALRKSAGNNFLEINSEIENCRKQISDYEIRIDDLSNRLKGSNIREIAAKEEALGRSREEIDKLNRDIGSLKQERAGYESRLNALEKQRDRQLKDDNRVKGLKREMGLLKSAISRLEYVLNIYRQEARDSIVKKVNDILEITARRDYELVIEPDFSLRLLRKGTKAEVAKSSGENQLVSLAFIASLVGFSADREDEDNNHLLRPGAMAPLVLDSPFGQLDSAYKRSTAKFLPSLARQVILLVSKTQGDPETLNILGSHIGAEYVLISKNTAERGDKPQDIIELDGNSIECSVYGADKDMTEIMQVK